MNKISLHDEINKEKTASYTQRERERDTILSKKNSTFN